MEKSTRPVRNRRHNRRVWPPGDTHRPIKRLFTPEIKRMLKDWLVRRRDNPYPSRDEKKALAFETGLTYTQICNWFANWRRKLKNSGRERAKKTWGHLIKNYNVNAKGNVEQFSICSNDSIWGDDERSSNISNSPSYSNHFENSSTQRKEEYAFSSNSQRCPIGDGRMEKTCNNDYRNYFMAADNEYENQNESAIDHYYTTKIMAQPQCFQISSTTADDQNSSVSVNDGESFKNQQNLFTANTKYKQQMMEKYLRDSCKSPATPELSKWLESAANFTPNKNNYYIEWNSNKNRSEKKQHKSSDIINCSNIYINSVHQKEELDAAEALANLACNYRQRIINSGNYLPTY